MRVELPVNFGSSRKRSSEMMSILLPGRHIGYNYPSYISYHVIYGDTIGGRKSKVSELCYVRKNPVCEADCENFDVPKPQAVLSACPRNLVISWWFNQLTS